jgi:hypothetical protein
LSTEEIMIDNPTNSGRQKQCMVLLTLFVILLIDCQEEKISIPDSGRKIVLNGLITTDTLLNVIISKSAYLTDMGGIGIKSLTDLDSREVGVYQNNVRIDSLYNLDYYSFDHQPKL